MEQDKLISEIRLAQNLDKSSAEAPDFTGEARIGGCVYDGAAWFGEIGRGTNKGRPYIGLQLTSTDNTSSQKVNVSLWEKRVRGTEAEPHFKTREMVNNRLLKFSAWVEPAGAFHALRVLIESFTASDDELSDASRETQKRLEAFVKGAQSRLPDRGRQPELPINAPKKEPDPDLDTEPDGLPF
jgi:hypothetical protein